MLYMMFIGKHLLPKVELDADQEIEQEVEATTTSSSKQIISGVILLDVYKRQDNSGHDLVTNDVSFSKTNNTYPRSFLQNIGRLFQPAVFTVW